jgi:predicted cobalt transporter CbtA
MSLAIILFWGFFILMYAFGTEKSLPNNLHDAIAYIAMLVTLVSLAAAWKWERAGSLLALAAFALQVIMNGKILLSPSLLMPIPAILFLLCGWLSKRPDPAKQAS